MNSHVAEKLLGLLEIGNQGIQYLEKCINSGEINTSDISVFDSVAELLMKVEIEVKYSTLPHRVKEILANLFDYIDKLKESFTEDRSETFVYDFRFHFCSLFRLLGFEVAYIVEEWVDKQKYPSYYPEVTDINHEEIIESGKNAKYKVSIILLAYNNLNYTRDCVYSILDNLGDIDAELILVDNGSNDGTKEFFDSVENAKVIHLKHNIHLVKGFNIGLMAAEGRYCAAVCNDFIFTPNWLENLLICIESDSKIGFVSPGATSISNMQQINIPFYSKEDFQKRAKAYNVSNSSKWEERVVLLPNVLCCPTALLEKIGYYDTRFYRGEFLDDDISFRIRRAGYKLVYCADTVAHHYGSLTTANDHMTNSLEEGRKTFVHKYGLDAWAEARMSPIYQSIDYQQLSNIKSILGIDVKCGATLLQIKNTLWSKFGAQPEIATCTTESKYVKDLKSISKQTLLIENLQDLPVELASKFDMIFIEKPLNYYNENIDVLFKILTKVMNKNSTLIFTVNNALSLEGIYDAINSPLTVHGRKIYMRDKIYLSARNEGFSHVSTVDFITSQDLKVNEAAEKLSEAIANSKEQKDYLYQLLKSGLGMYQLTYC